MKVLITGITGMDGSHLCELMLDRGHSVFGVIRRHSSPASQTVRIDHLRSHSNLTLMYGDVMDSFAINAIICEVRPDMIFHLAAQSHVQVSFENPLYTCQVNCLGTLNILESARQNCKEVRIYHAGTSEMFGNNFDPDGYQRETTPFKPVSPYGSAKLYGHNLCDVYRSAYGMFICSGILFNHESPRRGLNFVTSKVVKTAVEIKNGLTDKLELGNLSPRRDWGHAEDYVRGMVMMLEQSTPKDYVLATGESHSVQDLVDYVFAKLKLDMSHLVQNDKYIRPKELWNLKGDASKAGTEMGWFPSRKFEQILDEMIAYWNVHI